MTKHEKGNIRENFVLCFQPSAINCFLMGERGGIANEGIKTKSSFLFNASLE